MAEWDNLWERIGEILRSRKLHLQKHRDSRLHAAVLVPLLKKNRELCVLLTQRTRDVAHHKGQISFPGGAVEECDGTLEETALREAHEEIGLPREYVEILGRIDDAETISSNFVVHPFVARVVTSSAFRLNPGEVERIITVPLGVFHPENVTTRREEVQWDGNTYKTLAFEYRDHVIWGATARILENLLAIIEDELLLSGNFK